MEALMKKVDESGESDKNKNQPLDEINEKLFEILNKRKGVSATKAQKFGTQGLGQNEVPKRKRKEKANDD